MMNASIKRLVAYHIARLQDKNRDIRLKAINELALLGDADALQPLQTIVEQDSDLELRKAAQEAGRAIYRQVLLRQQERSG
jgi:HEAT repeat protein